ncbi:MAG: IS66 family transposase, partial [Parasulfuritortus sp.]|nr:IS66 family transposase [Parasulfuritortus sp.]
MKSKDQPDLSQLNRAVFEVLDHDQLVELTCRLHRMAIEMAERLAMNSTNSSRPPSSDPPFGGGRGVGGLGSQGLPAGMGTPASATPPGKPLKPSGRKPGKQPGAKGKWRDGPLKAERTESHWPTACAHCGTPFEMWDKAVRTGTAFMVLELEHTSGGIRIVGVEHRYEVLHCACGHDTEAKPGTGVLSFLDGRQRQLHLTERSLIGPSLAAFIAALAIRHHQSRRKIGEFLLTWFGVPLATGTIDRCIREVGVACEPIVEDLLEEVRGAGIIHADETPWYQGVLNCWLWVVLTATTAVFHIGSRRHEEIRDLLGDAIIGWLVTDGYGAYRDYARRQRCLAHLIRKGLALAGSLNPDGVRFGEWLVRELRNLIKAVADDKDHTILNPIQARLKRACTLHRDHQTEKIRALAREILYDWDAIVAFVKNHALPPTNNEAERALRIAVIARRLSCGTRTAEGSAA